MTAGPRASPPGESQPGTETRNQWVGAAARSARRGRRPGRRVRASAEGADRARPAARRLPPARRHEPDPGTASSAPRAKVNIRKPRRGCRGCRTASKSSTRGSSRRSAPPSSARRRACPKPGAGSPPRPETCCPRSRRAPSSSSWDRSPRCSPATSGSEAGKPCARPVRSSSARSARRAPSQPSAARARCASWLRSSRSSRGARRRSQPERGSIPRSSSGRSRPHSPRGASRQPPGAAPKPSTRYATLLARVDEREKAVAAAAQSSAEAALGALDLTRSA